MVGAVEITTAHLFTVSVCSSCLQALSDDKKRIIDEYATMGTAESWDPMDLSKDHPQLAGKRDYFTHSTLHVHHF